MQKEEIVKKLDVKIYHKYKNAVKINKRKKHNLLNPLNYLLNKIKIFLFLYHGHITSP